jgi:D-serine deaminase-like pyridoxal phosphate-dependent protein
MENAADMVGRHKSELDTPALLIDLDTLDRNIAKMVELLRGGSCGLRPHFKAHRTPAIMRRQLAAGGHGVTCAKLGEAEHLADEGLDHFLVANEIYGDLKWDRLARLAQRVEVMVGVDSAEAVRGMGRAARAAGTEVGVLVDVNSGLNRCGVAPGAPALELARRVAEEPGLSLRGVMAYEGHVMGLGEEEKRAAAQAALGPVIESAEQIRADGLPVPIVSAGGTGTFLATSRLPGITELQCGTYAVMDILFHEQGGAPFEYAVTVLTTVISRPTPSRAVTDAGKKGIHASFGWARPVNLPGAKLTGLHSEHGILELEGEAQNLPHGAKVEFIPFYVEGTINLHDRMYVLQNDRVVDVWEVSGRDHSR